MLALIRAEIAKDRWIFEGNHTSSFAERVARVDTMIFLDLGTLPRVWRVILRTVQYYGKSRPDMGPGCPERFDWDFLVFCVTYAWRGSRQRALSTLLDAPSHIQKHHLRTRREVDRFLDAL